MRDSLLLAFILCLGATGCNSLEGLVGKKASSESAAAVTAPGGESGDAKAGDDKKEDKSCPVKAEGEDDSDDSGEMDAEKKAAKNKDKSGGEYEEMGLTHDGMETVDKVHEVKQDLLREALSDWRDDEIAAFAALYTRFIEKLDEQANAFDREQSGPAA